MRDATRSAIRDTCCVVEVVRMRQDRVGDFGIGGPEWWQPDADNRDGCGSRVDCSSGVGGRGDASSDILRLVVVDMSGSPM